MFSATIAVLGTLAGSALTFLFGQRTQRQRDRREDRLRWHKERLDAYVLLATKAAGAARMVEHAAALLKRGKGAEARETATQLSAMTEEIHQAQAVIQLVGHPEVAEAALQVYEAVGAVAVTAAVKDSALEDITQSRVALAQVIDRFNAVARAELHSDMHD